MDSKENIQFLIDYENVQEAGLDGAECLCYADTVAIFYSAVCDKIPRRFMNWILESGCEFQAYKLKKGGKNALEFWRQMKTVSAESRSRGKMSGSALDRNLRSIRSAQS